MINDMFEPSWVCPFCGDTYSGCGDIAAQARLKHFLAHTEEKKDDKNNETTHKTNCANEEN